MTRLSLISKTCAELEEVRRWYGVRDEMGLRWIRLIWEADQVEYLHDLIWEGNVKPRMCVSFSGGKTSGYMAYQLKTTFSDKYEMVFTFANTARENEETLVFANRCDRAWGLNLVWLEADVVHGERVGTGHRIVSFDTASRQGEPFEEVIKKYGIPNQAFPHCTRELKLQPIKSYLHSIGWNEGEYISAVGIRGDEPQRLRRDADEVGIVYPLAQLPDLFREREFLELFATKPMINDWWEEQSFNLELEEYEGNCRECWKKHTPKLVRIAQETPETFDFFKRMEQEHSMDVRRNSKGTIPPPYHFFRNNMSTKQLLQLAGMSTVLPVTYDPDEFSGCSESCEAFAFTEATC